MPELSTNSGRRRSAAWRPLERAVICLALHEMPHRARHRLAAQTYGSADDSALRPRHRITIGPMQPLAELTLTRPWHWGIAVLGDPMAEVPTKFDGCAVTVGRDVVALSVRHAQDIEAERFEGDWDWATATIYVRSLAHEEATERHVLCDTVIATSRETVSLGDADGMVIMPAPSARTLVIVSVNEVTPTGLERAWVDLVAVED